MTKDKYALKNFHEIPLWQRSNPYILTGYRVGYDLPMLFRSTVMLHNETSNVWTHLGAFFIVLAMTIYFYAYDAHDLDAVDHGVFFAFLVGNFSMTLFSSLYHLLWPHNQRTYSVFMLLDYTGISCCIVGSFIPALWWAFACHSTLRLVYISMIAFLGSVVIVLPFFKFFDARWFKPIRIGLYVLTGGSGVVPAIHSFLVFPRSDNTQLVHVGVALMFFFYAFGVLFYISKFPECMFKGRFDYFGSHAIWHIFVALAAIAHFGTVTAIYQRFSTVRSCGL